ncbi:MAG: hypothetical protein PWQ59_1476 [Thermoanaerobacterium sp.]|nr:hypothetical protein [Thermoanaerobacterium sp.]MDK2905063.1 hypothetical protein [Eubacteriaceae bacterium]
MAQELRKPGAPLGDIVSIGGYYMIKIRKVAYYPHCGNRAPQKLVYTQEYFDKGYDTEGKLVDSQLRSKYYVAVCETCNQILLYNAFIEIVPDSFFYEAELVWPEFGQLHKSVPSNIHEIYLEPSRIKELAPNAFAAVQIRKDLEAICDDRGVKNGSLKDRLDDLASKGEIPPKLAEITQVLRLLGNIGAYNDT